MYFVSILNSKDFVYFGQYMYMFMSWTLYVYQIYIYGYLGMYCVYSLHILPNIIFLYGCIKQIQNISYFFPC